MISNRIHQALAQVEALQRSVLDSQKFRGYSGPARAVAGSVSLIAAAVLSSASYPATVPAHLLGWGVVFSVSLVVNYGAMFYWFFCDPEVGRDWRKLRPTLDVIPPLVVGGLISIAAYRTGETDLLFGIWMSLFGLANLAWRRVLPRSLVLVGAFYVLAGAACLLLPGVHFLNPWPMGLVFFIGEWVGGLILHLDRTRRLT